MNNLDGIKIVAPRLEVRVEAKHKFWPRFVNFITRSFSTPQIICLVIASFIFGAFVTWRAGALLADGYQFQNVTPPGSLVLSAKNPMGAVGSLPNKVLFNMTLSQLEYYLEEGYKTPEMKQGEMLGKREHALRDYLVKKKSPLFEISDTLARLRHWRVVLAISNSESSLGRRCANNNCSGIGVEPGHPLWREYASKADWAKDLDRLIEKRYKDWTLEEMNGVYNQPGSENWVFAATQILNDLQDIP